MLWGTTRSGCPGARPGGPAADLAWASGLVERSGPAVQHRSWNLSAIWSMPPAEGRAWLKCVPGFYDHESAVLGLLAGPGVPRLIAAAGHRILLRDMGGRDGHGVTVEERRTGPRPSTTAGYPMRSSTATPTPATPAWVPSRQCGSTGAILGWATHCSTWRCSKEPPIGVSFLSSIG
jgi:hypothetical protein